MFRWLRKILQQVQDPTTQPHDYAAHVEVDLDSKRRDLRVDHDLKDVPGVTMPMLVAFGENGIKTVDDLAGCATDDLIGWTESKTRETMRHPGILDRFEVSRKDCEAMIIYARIKAGWIDRPS